MSESKDELAKAFPSVLGMETRNALSALPDNPRHRNSAPFFVYLGNERIAIPGRIYFYPPPPRAFRSAGLESELLDCVFTRHNDGFVRQVHLLRIIRSTSPWVPCFVVPLIGEYVVEIIQVIQDNLPHVSISAYTDFVRANPEFMALTEKRVMSYWNCYYRGTKKEDYPGFIVLNFLKSLIQPGSSGEALAHDCD